MTEATKYGGRVGAVVQGGTDARRWLVLLGCFVGMGIAPPATLLVPMGLFLKAMTGEFGWSRTQFSLAVSGTALANALAMPVAGSLVDRFGPRRIIAIGVVLGSAAYAAMSLATSFATFVLLAALTAGLANLASYPAFMGLAQRWFDRRLGLALALTSTGLAAGTAGFSYLIATTTASHGWRTAFVVGGCVIFAVGIANLLLLVRDNTGPMPDAERRPGTVLAEVAAQTLGAAARTRDFWLYSLSFMLVVFAVVACNVHLPALLGDQGAAPELIASVVAIGSAGSLFGRLVTGTMLDRFSVRGVATLFLSGQVVGLLLLLAGIRWALPADFLLGTAQGAEIDMLGYLVARRFGRPAYARIFGASFAITLLGAIIGPVAMAAIFDRTGSYNLGLGLLAVLPILALGLLWPATRKSVPAAGSMEPLPITRSDRTSGRVV